MTAVASEPNQTKPWEKEQIPFNFWYRKKLQGDFGTALTLVDVTRDVIKNGGSKDEMYQTFIANLQEAQARLTQLLFELEEADMELALKINDAICSTLDWAKKCKVSSLLPDIPSTKEVTTLVANMLKRKSFQKESTDEKKVEDLIVIELQVGVGADAKKRMVNLPRGSTFVDLINCFASLRKRSQITWVREGSKVEETTVLLNGDSIIAVLAKVEGPFEGFGDLNEDQKTMPAAAIVPIAPPPEVQKKPEKVRESAFKDLLTDAPPQEVPVADPLDFINIGAKATSENVNRITDVDVDVAVKPVVEDKSNNNPFDPLIEQPGVAANANPFEDFENEEEEPLITFDRFSIDEDGDVQKEVKEVTEKDKLLGDDPEAQKTADMERKDSFPKFAGFS
jgi:hypothetical protein